MIAENEAERHAEEARAAQEQRDRVRRASGFDLDGFGEQAREQRQNARQSGWGPKEHDGYTVGPSDSSDAAVDRFIAENGGDPNIDVRANSRPERPEINGPSKADDSVYGGSSGSGHQDDDVPLSKVADSPYTVGPTRHNSRKPREERDLPPSKGASSIYEDDELPEDSDRIATL